MILAVPAVAIGLSLRPAERRQRNAAASLLGDAFSREPGLLWFPSRNLSKPTRRKDRPNQVQPHPEEKDAD